MSKYTKEYFIKKFEAIPEDEWTDCGNLVNDKDSTKKCALGHCGLDDYNKPTEEAFALCALFGGLSNLTFIEGNDSANKHRLQNLHGDLYQKVYQVNDCGPSTPKQRVLNHLYKL